MINKIILDKKKWIFENKKNKSLNFLVSNVFPSKKKFYSSFNRNRCEFILEYKIRSPIFGAIRNNLDLLSIIKVYRKYASVISIITDEPHFGGSFSIISKIREYVYQPILCKDFIIDVWQIYLARYYQADAVLLILSILDDNLYINLVNVAHSLNMGVLTEISNEQEKERAIYLKSKVVGINNRNLNNFSIDINKSIILSNGFSKKVIVISESGIIDNFQVRKLSNYVNGFLIGTSIMKSNNIDLSIKQIIFGNNKVCGLTRSIDAKNSFSAGFIYGGLIFINNSIRNITLNLAKKIVNSVSSMRYIGVFQNSSIYKIVEIVFSLNLYGIQLHGKENSYYIQKLRKMIPKNVYIWKAYDVNYDKLIFNIFGVNKYVLDNGGGSGKPFNWKILPKKFLNDIILSGGLNIYNCKKVMNFKCFGLDFNSGLEIFPGIKSSKKIFKLFSILRSY